MKKTAVDSSTVVKTFGADFLAPDYKTHFQSFSDLIWQILVNGIYSEEKVCFWVDVNNEKNQLIIADIKGGYIKTGIRFNDDDYNKCVKTVEALNNVVFELTVEQADKLISTSMLHNDNLK